jgi:hypothetical protein
VLGCTVYLHTPDGYPRSELRRVLARAGGPTSAPVAGTARNWATVSRLVELLRAHGSKIAEENRFRSPEAGHARPGPVPRLGGGAGGGGDHPAD